MRIQVVGFWKNILYWNQGAMRLWSNAPLNAQGTCIEARLQSWLQGCMFSHCDRHATKRLPVPLSLQKQIYNWVPLKTGENITKKIVNRTISKCQPCRPSRRDTTEVLETCRSLVSLSQELMVAFHALSPWWGRSSSDHSTNSGSMSMPVLPNFSQHGLKHCLFWWCMWSENV